MTNERSGGGNRSAAFSIGVLRALHEKRLLDTVDVMSAVSGGSYALSWYLLQPLYYALTDSKASLSEMSRMRSIAKGTARSADRGFGHRHGGHGRRPGAASRRGRQGLHPSRRGASVLPPPQHRIRRSHRGSRSRRLTLGLARTTG